MGIILWAFLIGAEEVEIPIKNVLKTSFQKKAGSETQFQKPLIWFDLLQGRFSEKIFWENELFALGFGQKSNGDHVLFVWMKEGQKNIYALRELLDIYLDDTFALIKTEQDLQEWNERRRILLLPFMEAQKGKKDFLAFSHHKQPSVIKTIPQNLGKVPVETVPLIVFIPSERDQINRLALSSSHVP